MNSGQRTVELKPVQLSDRDNILLDEALAVPPAEQDDGTMLVIGIMHDPATETPDLWAGRQPVARYMIPPIRPSTSP